MLMVVLDSTVVSVALPSIQEDLGFSQSDLSWTVNAYLIAFGGLLLLSGRLGDLIGQRRVLLIGLVVFTIASLACALAQTPGTLIAARFGQGVGGALTSAVLLAMIVTIFPEQGEQAKAIGVYGFVASVGSTIGLPAGGLLTEGLNWHWIFLVNVPIGAVLAVLVVRLLDDHPGSGFRQGADLPGAALLTVGLMLGVYAILEVEELGWGATQTVALGAVSLALLVAFTLRQARASTPLVPLRLFRVRNIAGANLALVFTVVGMFGMGFMGALYMQRILGYSPLEVGYAFLPTSILSGVVALRVSPSFAARVGDRRTILVSLALLGASMLLFARAPLGASYLVDILPIMLLAGTGTGLMYPVLTRIAMSGARPEDTGLASGLASTTPQIGGAIGLAVLATIAAERTSHLLGEGAIPAAALNAGYHRAYVVGAALVLVAAVVVVAVLRPADAVDEPADPAESEPAYAEA
jgi:EmrB/QacA subfamily drug resistance transporter